MNDENPKTKAPFLAASLLAVAFAALIVLCSKGQ